MPERTREENILFDDIIRAMMEYDGYENLKARLEYWHQLDTNVRRDSV